MSTIRKHKLTFLFGILPLVLTSCSPFSNREDINQDSNQNQNQNDGGNDEDPVITDFVMLCGLVDPSETIGSLNDIYVNYNTSDYLVKRPSGWVLCGNTQTENGEGHTGDLPCIYLGNQHLNDATGKVGDICVVVNDDDVIYYIKLASGWVLKGEIPEIEPTPSNKKVKMWSCFSIPLTEKLNTIVNEIDAVTEYEINHTSKGRYDLIYRDMISSIAAGDYPNLVFGSPDQFAVYHGCNILEKLDDYVDGDMMNDFIDAFIHQNYFYDRDSTKHLYSLPVGKSTEFLYYNQVFVEYCDWKNPGLDLLNIPRTWDEWSDYENPNSKVSIYKSEFDDLINNHRVVYAVQDYDGHAHDFVYSNEPIAGKTKVFDYLNVSGDEKATLFAWDSPENAFITLLRQWDSQYTVLHEDQYNLPPKKRQGTVLFANNDNIEKTIDMLKFLNRLNKNGIFDVNTSYLQSLLTSGFTMFSVMPSAFNGLSAGSWQTRIKPAPIPYRDSDYKYVITQGADICLTDRENKEAAFDLLSKLTTGQYQAEWAKESGYFPVTKSAYNTATYQSFLNSTSYENIDEVYNRESSKAFVNDYNDWIVFCDEPFIGSLIVRNAVYNIIPNVLSQISEADIDQDEKYFSIIRSVLSQPEIRENININVELVDY